ncbi:hypothetical protein WH91_20975, partial [Devosia psychrophila]
SSTKPFPAAPGKFVLLRHVDQRHPFSISGIDALGRVRLSIKMSGPFTRGLYNIGVGTEVILHGPYGHFGENILSAAGPQLWIAGGIGITPFLSALQALSKARTDQIVHLIWSVRSKGQAMYAAEIATLMASMSNGRFTIHDSGLYGKLTAAAALGGAPMAEHVFLCGPGAMTSDLEAQFQTTGLRDEQIVSERFKFR